MTVKVLNRVDGLTENIGPTGVKYDVVLVKGGNMLFNIKASLGTPPAYIAGTYTSAARAQTELTRFLVTRWNESDEVADKAARKRA